ncbi:L-rhamnose-proton symporter [Rubripirellula obstinata]|uniref:L-rhamnose-proton symporter n=1 Tax=Rubripirellula obstinata TaxID=406547 RepID=A0A5B1CP07_9BACT|nr:L-rhamnose/proton symporter RhaT [Rubripirellula obstinata]KAA1261103.1 L-rhamnose-proton symporter [Rubripirellula obstinata]
MFIGILAALIAGTMLGLYALPGKFTSDFEEENKWSLFFILTMFAVPLIATFGLMKGVGAIYSEIDSSILITMIVSSFLWGVGVMMWGKAIDHIGMSLGFSLFIGTVILVGSVLPLGIAISKGQPLPSTPTLIAILIGIAIVLMGVLSNGKAGLKREADEMALKAGEAKAGEARAGEGSAGEGSAGDSETAKPKSYAIGILIAVTGGLLATGFNVAFTYGAGPLADAVKANGNPGWMTAMAVMLPVFLSGGVAMTVYFLIQLSKKKAWGKFKTPAFGKNFVLIFIMAVFHYAASAMYAFAADSLGANGPVVVYAIFNTTCLVVAVVSGILTGEWTKASPQAKRWLYTGLTCMVVGVLVLAYGQTLDQPTAVETTVETAANSFMNLHQVGA